MMSKSFTLSDEQKQSLIDTLISEWEYMKASYSREELEDDCGNSGIDIRLQVVDGRLQLHTGDSQYDPNHLGYWGYATLDYNWDGDDLEALVNDVVKDLISQIEEAMIMY